MKLNTKYLKNYLTGVITNTKNFLIYVLLHIIMITFLIGGGCGGFNYNIKHMTFGEYTKIYDTHKKNIYTIQHKTAKVIIDPPSEMLLFGTTIDYVSNDFDSKFIFIPQKDLATTCGCGTSFSLKTSTH